jgi:hypothetical protein
MRGAVALEIEHRAMMLAVAAAAGRKASVRILRECQQRRNHREREGREQQDGQQASHDRSGSFSLRPRSPGVYVRLSLCLLRFCQPQRSCGLSWV